MRLGASALRTVSPLLAAALALTLAAAMLGGASHDARPLLMTVEFIALPVAALALRRLDLKRVGWVVAPIFLLIAIPTLQCVPLPAELWLKAPGQDARFAALTTAGVDLGWRPLSLDPRVTLAAVPALFPPIAMFLATLSLRQRDLWWITVCWIAVALAGLMLGLAQIAQPDGGWAYLYAETNTGSLVGWFANRNHEAAMLLALMPCAAVLAAARGGVTRWIAAGFLLLVFIAIGAVGSRAGLILAAPVVVLTGAVLLRLPGLVGRRWVLVAFGGIAIVSVAALALFALTPILSRFGPDSLPEFRYRAWPLIWREAAHHLPFGSGVGTFDRVYRAIEPLSFVGPKFFNHAHNDYLEVWLEDGWLGAVALAAVTAWFVVAAIRAWSSAGSSLARAASIGVLTLMAMSAVDYPLRTEAVATLFAFLLATTAAAPESRRDG